MGISNSASRRSILPVCITALYLFIMTMVNMLPAFAIAQGYTTDDTGLQTGMVAALTTNEAANSNVERATQENSQRIVGVVTTFEDSSITLASKSAVVLVEGEGEVNAYVSDLGGKVERGSLLTLSPLKGVLMKTDSASGAPVVAIASEEFSSVQDGINYPVEDSSTTKNTKISRVKITLSRQGTSTVASAQQSSISKLGKAITGKEVSEIRVIIALILFVIVLIAEGSILYGVISSSVTALGRNPLARKIIRREMMQVVIVAIVVLFVGLGAVYGVLLV